MMKTNRTTNRAVRCIPVLLAILMIFTGCGVQENQPSQRLETVPFTDSLGRRVEIPADITRVSPSGGGATMFLECLAPDVLVTMQAKPDEVQLHYLDARLAQLPVTGSLYGGKSAVNLESLLLAEPQIIIDMGEPKEGMIDDLNALQETLQIPVIFIRADLGAMESAFRTLGTVLPRYKNRADELAELAAETLQMAAENCKQLRPEEQKKVVYGAGPNGLNVHCAGSVNAQVLETVGAVNGAVLDQVSNKGTGSPVSMEQWYRFAPDVIFFGDPEACSAVRESDAWNQLEAIETGAYYPVPQEPFNWLSTPSSVNTLLGIWWAGNKLYPRLYGYDMVKEAQRIFRILWQYDLTEQEARALLQAE